MDAIMLFPYVHYFTITWQAEYIIGGIVKNNRISKCIYLHVHKHVYTITCTFLGKLRYWVKKDIVMSFQVLILMNVICINIHFFQMTFYTSEISSFGLIICRCLFSIYLFTKIPTKCQVCYFSIVKQNALNPLANCFSMCVKRKVIVKMLDI